MVQSSWLDGREGSYANHVTLTISKFIVWKSTFNATPFLDCMVITIVVVEQHLVEVVGVVIADFVQKYSRCGVRCGEAFYHASMAEHRRVREARLRFGTSNPDRVASIGSAARALYGRPAMDKHLRHDPA